MESIQLFENVSRLEAPSFPYTSSTELQTSYAFELVLKMSVIKALAVMLLVCSVHAVSRLVSVPLPFVCKTERSLTQHHTSFRQTICNVAN